MVANYKAFISAFEAVIKPDFKNANTEAVTKAGDNADSTWRGLRGQVIPYVASEYMTGKDAVLEKLIEIIKDKYAPHVDS